ncbi:DUF411 domain-containing protein [Pollutimonas bauzanensis]|uniref:Uncharacterized conserved protein n=1 Tax=Pollutimonas bauzanensis TaxID=658167 RepID=A0A1M5WDI4_9BURK|nr:DUF411 domain-containing protein [Pollutimonas bauzanensis]SHH85468.1 Uncharacterized conserved protein [Pollutimonas bauzanensis]
MAKTIWFGAALLAAATATQAAAASITVYQDPDCGCCSGWVQHMQASGFTVAAVKTRDMAAVKARLGVPGELASCHTAIVDASGQVIEGHVPAAAVNKLIADPSIKGAAAPGMPANSPGMGQMDGKLVTVDFNGKPLSRD